MFLNTVTVIHIINIGAGEGFSVAFDPLDGSSIVDTNFTVGTIFGVWPGDKLVGVTGRDQVHFHPPAPLPPYPLPPYPSLYNPTCAMQSVL